MRWARFAAPGDSPSGPLAPRKRGEGWGEGLRRVASGPLAPRQRGEGRGEGRRLVRFLAATLTLFLLTAPSVSAAEEPPACASPLTASPSGLNSWPKCIDVAFQGGGVTGLPPLSFTWKVSNGYRFFGNPGTLQTQALDPGSYTAHLVVSNPWGSGQSFLVPFSIEPLQFTGTPLWANLGGRQVEVTARAEGATEYRWTWGDGQVSPWLSGCGGARTTHIYPAVGSYTARLDIRNCEDPAQTGASFVIAVTEQPQLSVLVFEAFCPIGFCLFETGEPIFFTTLVQGTPTAYVYDWNGDGLTDEVSSLPVVSHAYTQPGTYTPRLTIVSGTQTATLVHGRPLIVLSASGETPIFADGFESGTTAAWSLVVGESRGAEASPP